MAGLSADLTILHDPQLLGLAAGLIAIAFAIGAELATATLLDVKPSTLIPLGASA